MPVVANAVPREIHSPGLGNVIDRVMRDVSIPPDRIAAACEYLVQVSQRRAYYEAWPAMQAALPTVARTGTIEVPGRKGRSYATLDDTIHSVRNIMNDHGFGVRSEFRQGDGQLTAIVFVIHRGGHMERTEFSVPYDAGQGRNAVQSVGSARTYALRYALTAALCIGTADDDDGESTGPKQKETPLVTPEQTNIIEAAINILGVDTARFCTAWKIKSVRELHAVDYTKALAALRRRMSEEDAKEFGEYLTAGVEDGNGTENP